MSKLFYDHLILIDEVFTEIEELPISSDEKKDIQKLVDEMVHHAVLTHILDLLPRPHHEEFLNRLHAVPYDVQLIAYLDQKIEKSIHQEIAQVGEKLKKEIRREIKKHTRK